MDSSTVINSDGWRGYNGLVDLGYGRFRVDHSKDEFANGTVHINGIEGFWGLAKVRLAKLKGLPRHTFHLHLKETEWRFDHRKADKYKTLLRYLRQNPLSQARPKMLFGSEELSKWSGGWGGIRTHEGLAPLPVFKTGAFDRSATHPGRDTISPRAIVQVGNDGGRRLGLSALFCAIGRPKPLRLRSALRS